MKISFVEPHLQLFGGIRRIIEFANRLHARGHDVTIFHSDGNPCDWMSCTAKVKSYDDILDEIHDVIIYNDPNPIDYRLVREAEAKLKVFYVLELYEKQLLKGDSFRIFLPGNKRMRILKRSLRSPYLIMVNATWEKEWLEHNMNIDTTLLFGGINTDVFFPTDSVGNSNEIRILTPGDPRERKGTKIVLEAFQIAKKEEPGIVLNTYHGKGIPQQQMANLYSSADLFVEASFQAGWNNPVAEAMACKVPVVCTDIGGVKDFAYHETTALLVPPGDPRALAAAIVRLLRDDELREKLRENAYAHIMQFNWNESVTRLEDVLESGLKMKDINPSYIGSRDDVLSLIPNGIDRVLDVGCSVGALGESIKKKLGAEVIGVELDERTASIARRKLDKVITGNIEDIDLADHFPPAYFDCIIFADVLEHHKDCWKVLKNLAGFLKDNGLIIASIPNVRHYSTIINILFKGYWPYRERGIHDKTHLRFFTLRNIRELFQYAGVDIIKVTRKYRIIENPHAINRFSKFVAIPLFRDFLTFQYLVVAKKTGSS